MPMNESHVNDQLTVDVLRGPDSITIHFLGKSILRDPLEFLLPILLKTLAEANESKRRLVMDFRDLSYMNSSTLTPVIKVLERARVGDGKVTALYRRALKWQDISFSALDIFQTPDGRIEITGSD